MRLIGHALLLILALCLLVVGAVTAARLWDDGRRLAPGPVDTLGDRVVFEAMPGKALRFNVSNHQGWAAVRGFVAARQIARRRSLPLTIDIEVLDGARRRLAMDRRFLELQAVDSPPPPYGRFAGSANDSVWLLPEEWIDLGPFPQAREIRVRLLEADPAIAEVAWRASIETRLSDEATRLRYNRLGSRSRDALTAAWVTPASLIAPETKREIVRRQQQPVGPLGREGSDYRKQRVLRGLAERRRRTFPTANLLALPIAPDMRVSWQLHAPTAVRVNVQTDDPAAPAMELWRAGPGGAHRSALLDQSVFAATLPAGLYELRAGGRGRVDVRDTATGNPLAPAGLRTQAFQFGPSLPLSYRLFAAEGVVPGVRIHLRPTAAPANVRVQVLDGGGRLLRTERVALGWRPSPFDRAVGALDRPVGEATHLLIAPPVGARTLRLESDNAVLATVFTESPRYMQPARRSPSPSLRRWYAFLPERAPGVAGPRAMTVLQQPRTIESTRVRRPPSRGIGAAKVAPPPAPRLRLRPDDRDIDQEDSDAPY